MSVRDVQAHPRELYWVQVSTGLSSQVTDAVVDDARASQRLPEDVYPILFLDAFVVGSASRGLKEFLEATGAVFPGPRSSPASPDPRSLKYSVRRGFVAAVKDRGPIYAEIHAEEAERRSPGCAAGRSQRAPGEPGSGQMFEPTGRLKWLRHEHLKATF